MFSHPHAEMRLTYIGAPGWCWSHLADAEEGVLSYSTPRGPVALAVPYAVTNHQITIPMAPFNDTGWLATDGEATLEVTGTDSEDMRWRVRATGLARRAASWSAASIIARQSHPAAGNGCPSVAPADGLVLPSARVRGSYQTRSPEAPSFPAYS